MKFGGVLRQKELIGGAGPSPRALHRGAAMSRGCREAGPGRAGLRGPGRGSGAAPGRSGAEREARAPPPALVRRLLGGSLYSRALGKRGPAAGPMWCRHH